MQNQLTLLNHLRHTLYHNFTFRKDAIFNLLDAVSSDGYKYKSVISLSESKYFPRKYSSITDAIADGLQHMNWGQVQKIIWPLFDCKTNGDSKYYRFVVDSTPNQRAFSNCLSGRTIINTPNPTPGNKPIGVGHQYSVLACIPPGDSKRRKTWIAPVDVKRVLPTEKSHEVGVTQITKYIKEANLENALCLIISDSAYGTTMCRSLVTNYDNLVQIFRMRSSRAVYKLAKSANQIGRTKKYGSKFILNKNDNNIEPDFCQSFVFKTKKDKVLTVKAERYENMIFKGTKDYKASDHPFDLVKYTVFDESGEQVFKKPLWIAIVGKRRKEISISEGFTNYMDRYDIEHFFKFAKNNLLADKYQSPETKHEESWWKLILLAYLQLFYARNEVSKTPKTWERYLPEFKNTQVKVSSPSQTQRGFNKILNTIGTPAILPVPRGNPLGRKLGDKQKKRKVHPIIFKGKSVKNKLTKGLNKTSKNSNPKKTKNDLIDTIIDFIKKSKLSHKEVARQILMAL